MGDDDDLKRGRSTAALVKSFDVGMEDPLVVNSNLEQPSRKRLRRDRRQAAATEKQHGEK